MARKVSVLHRDVLTIKLICLITERGVKLAACHISHMYNYHLTSTIKSSHARGLRVLECVCVREGRDVKARKLAHTCHNRRAKKKNEGKGHFVPAWAANGALMAVESRPS